MKKPVLLFVSLVLFFSCNQENLLPQEEKQDEIIKNPTSHSITPEIFDWENDEWMPTPSGQPQIPTPWVMQGGLSSTYGADVINDRKNSDGWELLYSTFTSEGTAPIQNPYFILYNKYRGILRIYVYSNTSLLFPPTMEPYPNYLTSSLFISSGHDTALLHSMGNEIIEDSPFRTLYTQILPVQLQYGAYSLSINGWYMMEYELAYDSNLANIPHNEMQMSWNLGFCHITDFHFNGTSTNTIQTAVGANTPLLQAIGNNEADAVKGVLRGIGLTLLEKNKLDDNGNNSLGIPAGIFKNLYNGAIQMAEGAQSGLSGCVPGILNAIQYKGTNKPLNLTINMDIQMEGDRSIQGSFPSTPVSFWVPGTNFIPPVVGYVPLYNKPLGIINISNLPTLDIPTTLQSFVNADVPMAIRAATFDMTSLPDKEKFWNYLIINPEVKKIANIKPIAADLLMIPGEKMRYSVHESAGAEPYGEKRKMFLLPAKFSHTLAKSTYAVPRDPLTDVPFTVAVRYTFEVVPKDGSPSTIMVKSFKIPVRAVITELPDKDV